MRRTLAALACVLWGAPALALDFENCSRAEQKVAEAAIAGAAELAVRAAAAVGDTAEYGAWFGPYSGPHAETVRANLKAIHRALGSDSLVAVCIGFRDPSCDEGTFAFVLTDRPATIHFCRPFFGMPTLAEAEAKRRLDVSNGTREGTIVHELSHFPENGDTGDDCYGREVCGEFARTSPGRAILTADSYQYFAEDVLIAWWRANR